jgi:hypothetical protein
MSVYYLSWSRIYYMWSFMESCERNGECFNPLPPPFVFPLQWHTFVHLFLIFFLNPTDSTCFYEMEICLVVTML